MDTESEPTRRIDASAVDIGDRAIDTERANDKADIVPADFFQCTAERRRSGRPWRLRCQTLSTDNRLNNEFTAVLSHELRNHLNAIGSAAYFLSMETSTSPSAVKAYSVIVRQVTQMARLVEDLLDVSRIRNGQLSLKLERTDLCAIVTHSVQTAEVTMQQRDHRLTTLFPDAPVWVQADSARLQQVFVNLLINAAKYTDAGGHIELFVEQDANQAVVRIRDTGIGIAPDVLPHVFDLFVRADSSSPRPDAGLGIGLALVRSLVESHGGCVNAASAGPRQGSEFTVRLPMARSSFSG